MNISFLLLKTLPKPQVSQISRLLTPIGLVFLFWICSLIDTAATVNLTWDPAGRNLSLSSSQAINGIRVTEGIGTLTVLLNNNSFDTSSSTSGVTYNKPATNSMSATISTGGNCSSIALFAPTVLLEDNVSLLSGKITFQTSAGGQFSLARGAGVFSGASDIVITADSVYLAGTVTTTNGTVTLAPASPTQAIELGGTIVPAILNLSSDEIRHISAATLAIGSSQSRATYVTGVVMPAAQKLRLISAGSINELGGIINVDQLELSGATIFINTTNRVANTTLLEGVLSLDSETGPALSGNLTIGVEGQYSSGVVQWFGNSQLPSNAAVNIGWNGAVDLNGHTQAVSNLIVDGGDLETSDGLLQMNGNISRINASHATGLLSGHLDLGGKTRTIAVDGNENYINLTGDLSIDAGLNNGGFIKSGPGALVLSGNSTLKLPCSVTRGSLLVDGILHASLELNPAESALTNSVYLSGMGDIDQITVHRDCLVVPGDISGQQMGSMLLTKGTSTFAAGSTLFFFIKGAQSSALLQTNSGTIDLSGSPNLSLIPYGAQIGSEYTLIKSDNGTVLGQFDSLPEGTVFQDNFGFGEFFQIHYATDRVYLNCGHPTDTFLTTTPETTSYGEPITFTATVNHPNVGNPTGTVIFKDSGSPIGSAPVMNGIATFTISTLDVGEHDVQAFYLGDAYFLPSSSTSTNHGFGTAPIILTQPADYTGVVDGSAQFTVNAGGYAPLFYQWRWNGSPLQGATNSTLVLNRLASFMAGNFDVIVTNYYGAATSQVARLTISSFFGFGDNRFGQSTLPAGVNGPKAVAIGWNHNVALSSDGTVTAWGDNSWQQLAVPASLTNVMAISAGGYHSLALSSNGVITAWGANWVGQTNVPSGLTNVVAVSAGGFHNLALKSDGTVTAWGYNAYQECNVPAGLSNVVAVAAGMYHSLALKKDGTVAAWGNDSLAQGNAPAGLSNATAIAAGSYFNMAILSDGTVYGWGDNRYGQDIIPADLNHVVAIACGDSHTLALRDDGTVVAWGHNQFLQAEVPPAIHHAVGIAAGGDHSMILGSETE